MELSFGIVIVVELIGVVLEQLYIVKSTGDYLWQNRVAILSRKPRTHKNIYYIVGCLELAVILYPVHISITIFILFLSIVNGVVQRM